MLRQLISIKWQSYEIIETEFIKIVSLFKSLQTYISGNANLGPSRELFSLTTPRSNFCLKTVRISDRIIEICQTLVADFYLASFSHQHEIWL